LKCTGTIVEVDVDGISPERRHRNVLISIPIEVGDRQVCRTRPRGDLLFQLNAPPLIQNDTQRVGKRVCRDEAWPTIPVEVPTSEGLGATNRYAVRF